MPASTQNLPIPPAGVKYIPLTKGKFAIVDEEDYEYLNQWKWNYSGNGYATRGTTVDGKKSTTSMHRAVNQTPAGKDTDHVNGNGLDNRRSNLRTATRRENLANGKPFKNNKFGLKGVSWHKKRRKYRAVINAPGKQIELGCFDDPLDAKKAYDEAAKRIHGVFWRA